MISLFLMLSLVVYKGPTKILIGPGQPIEPVVGQVTEHTVVLNREAVELRITTLNADQLRQHLAQMGAAQEVQDHQMIARLLEKSVTFMISLENRGTDHLQFNPDQIELLQRGKRPFGTKLGMLDLWPADRPGHGQEQERFARLFMRGSFAISPGQKAYQLLVFRPMAGQTWPKQVTLSIPHLYHGVEKLEFACRYDIKREKAEK